MRLVCSQTPPGGNEPCKHSCENPNIILSYVLIVFLVLSVLPALSDGWVGGWMDGLGGENREDRKDRRRENREQKQGEQ